MLLLVLDVQDGPGNVPGIQLVIVKLESQFKHCFF